MGRLLYIGRVALLFIGGAIALYISSCSPQPTQKRASSQNIITERSDDMKIIMSRNGRPSYQFEAPVIEGYMLANEPYREFREGVKIITYQDDSLSRVDAILSSKYAIYYENSQLWEARGDVVVVKSDGRELYTQQLFWDSRSKLIYSNVDTEIVDTNNNDTFRGEGFESDESMEKWRFRRLNGRMLIDVTTTPESQEESESSELDGAEPMNQEAVNQEAVNQEVVNQEAVSQGTVNQEAGDNIKEVDNE